MNPDTGLPDCERGLDREGRGDDQEREREREREMT